MIEPDAVLFDLDNTLADRSAAIRRVGEKLWRAEPAAQAKDSLEDAIELSSSGTEAVVCCRSG